MRAHGPSAPADQASPASISLQLQGMPRAVAGSLTLELAPVDSLMLAWLAVQGPTPRERLAQLLWPASELDAARAVLRQRLYKLRQALGSEPVSGRHSLALAPLVRHDLSLESPLLEGLSAVPEGELQRWLDAERAQRRSLQRQHLAARRQAAEDAGDWPGALALAHEALQSTPDAEEAHIAVVRLHYLQGDRGAALHAWERCVRHLREQLGAEPSAAALDLRRLIQQGSAGTELLAPPSRATLPAGVLRPPLLVGRDAEIRAAHDTWARGQVLALVAEAGMGKTRLLQQLVPAGQTAPVVAARPGDASVPLATLARWLRALGDTTDSADDEHAAALGAGVWAELAVVVPEWQTRPAGARGARPGLPRAVQQWLAHIGAPPLLALDDLHFADSTSLQVLQAVLESAPPTQRWALAYRPAEAGSALQLLHEALLDEARLEPVALAPLDEAALAALVDSLELAGVNGRELAPSLLRHTGGNPMFVLETLKQAWVDQRLQAPASGAARHWPRPGSVARLIDRRLQQLSAPALALARCAAVAGQSFSTALAVHVLGRNALELADAWAELEQAQVLRDQAFVHDLYFEGALRSVPAAVLRQLHGEIAAYLELPATTPRTQAAPAVLARHWLAAGLPERAAPYLQQAAEAATRAMDPAESARLWGRLSELRQQAGEAEAAFDAAVQAADMLRSVTSGAALEEAIQRAATLACHADHTTLVHERRAGMQLMRGNAALAEQELQLALAAQRADAPAAARASLLNMQGIVLRRAGRLDEARAALEQALELARHITPDPNDLLPAVLNNLGLTLQEADEHRAAITLIQEAAERQSDPMVRARVVNNLAISLEELGQAPLAREQRLAAARLVAGAGGPVELNLAISLARNARVLCRFREALQHIEQAQALLEQGLQQRADELHVQRALLWLALGRQGAAREAIELALATASNSASRATALLVRAEWHLSQRGDPHADLQAASDLLHASGSRAGLPHLLQLQARLLPAEQALALLQAQLQQPPVRHNVAAALPLHMALAQVLLKLDQGAQALRAAQRAADWLQAVWPLRVTPAEVLLTLAQAAMAMGDTTQAQAAADEAWAWVEATAREHIDASFHHAWLQRHPVHVALMALRSRAGHRR